jgi:putative inorganic carbon (hco3(-)) transporter
VRERKWQPDPVARPREWEGALSRVDGSHTGSDRAHATHPRLQEAGIHRYLLCILIFLLPVQFETSFALRIAPSDVVLLLILAYGGVWMRTSRSDWSLWHPSLVLAFSLGILNAALRYGVVTRWALLNKYVGLLILMLLYLVVVQYARSIASVSYIARIALLSVMIQAAISLPLYLLGLVYAPLYTPRIAGFLVDANAYGGFMVVGLCLHWSTVNSEGRLIGRRLAWPVTILILLNIFFTFSRSSWIGLAVVAVGMLAVNPRCWRHILVPGLLGLAAVALVFRPYFVTMFLPLILRPEQVSVRFQIIGSALNVFLAHPFLGAGLGSFVSQNGVEIHNTFLWFLGEMGIVGAVVVAGFFGWFVVRGVRAYRMVELRYRGLVGGLLMAHLAMLGFSLGIEASYQRYWWVILALLSASYSAARVARVEGARGSD